MKRYFLLIFLFFNSTSPALFAQQFKTPVEYNQYIVNEQQKVVNIMISFSNKFNTTDSLLMVNYNYTKNELKKVLENIRKLPPYEGDESLKNAALPLFELYYSAMDIEYKEIVSLFIKKDFGNKTQERVNSLLQSINEREKLLDVKFKQAQTDFAKKYDLKIENNQLQQEVNKLGNPK